MRRREQGRNDATRATFDGKYEKRAGEAAGAGAAATGAAGGKGRAGRREEDAAVGARGKK